MYPLIAYGSSAVSYVPGKMTVINVSWNNDAGTVYGGSINVTTGDLLVTWGEIASYAGEALPGEWLSSLDQYDPLGTPTTGAQVVYDTGSSTDYQLTPTDVTSVLGANTMYADTGDIDVDYRADTKMYIDSLIGG